MNVLFVANDSKDCLGEIGKEIIVKLNEMSFKVYVDNPLYLVEETTFVSKEDLKQIDFAIVLGGDGTILTFAHKYGEYEIPILGINLGRVGALAIAELSNYESYLEKILQKEYIVESRTCLEGRILFQDKTTESFVAYNDIALHRGSNPKLLVIDVLLNNTLENVFYADGVVFATPTGSSAYSLSAGGPLLMPNAKCYVLTPICPQFRAFSPIVLSENDSIELSIVEGKEKAILAVDGNRDFVIHPLDRIEISKANVSLHMLYFSQKGALYSSIYKVALSINKK